MARKAFNLDYSIERDTERVAAIYDILDKLEKKPSNADLELMANYIMYGKGEDGKNSVQRGETLENTKFSSWKREGDKFSSLDELLENPLADESTIQPIGERKVYTKHCSTIKRPKYDKNGNLIDPGHMNIPFMQQQWESIDRLQHQLNVSEGKAPADETTTPITDPLSLYKLKHMLIDVRRHQFYILDAYAPAIHFLNVKPNPTPSFTFEDDSAYWIELEEWQRRVASRLVSTISQNLDDYETRMDENGQMWVRWIVRHQKFDWENPEHIKHLINHYGAIYQQNWDKPDSWGRTLIYDFDRLWDKCKFGPTYEYIITRRIDKVSLGAIAIELEEKFGLHTCETALSAICARKIPQTMAAVAKRERLLIETPAKQRATCKRCGRNLPLHPMFFLAKKSRRSGFSLYCRECEAAKRAEAKGRKANG